MVEIHHFGLSSVYRRFRLSGEPHCFLPLYSYYSSLFVVVNGISWQASFSHVAVDLILGTPLGTCHHFTFTALHLMHIVKTF